MSSPVSLPPQLQAPMPSGLQIHVILFGHR